jgi:hypothetical protein
MNATKNTPTFCFVDSEHTELYAAEEKIQTAIRQAIELRAKKYNENYWACACPEVIAAILHNWDKKAIMTAINHYLETKDMRRKEYQTTFGFLSMEKD